LEASRLDDGNFHPSGKGVAVSLLVYVQNALFNFRKRDQGQTMAEYALILGGIAILVILALVFLGGRIRDLFESTGSSVNTPVS
jgi:Flp pilus assembly pilin Flp